MAVTKNPITHEDWKVILEQVKAYIDHEVTAANGDITAVAGKVNTLIGGDADKSVRAISAEEVAKIVAGANESYDTLKEIADWIMSDTTGAAKMANDIASALSQIGEKASEGKEATGIYKLIADEASRADAAEKANKKAIEDEVTRATGVEEGLDERLQAVEAKFEGEGSVESLIATAKQEAIDAAAEDATGKVNGLKDTAVSSEKEDGGVKVTLGGTVGAPTVNVEVTVATEAQVNVLKNIFAIPSAE